MRENIASLQALLPEWSSDALLVDYPIDLFYLTGLHLSAGRLIVARDAVELFVDGRYFTVAKAKSPFPVSPLEDALQRQFIERIGAQKIAFDSAAMSYDKFEKCEELFKRTLVPISSPLKNLRVIKTEEECDKMRKSAALAKEGVRHLLQCIKPGIAEKELAWQFEKFCRERGAARMAFDPIIAFGENTSFPHHRASNRTWKSGEPILIDVGCFLDDYASDVTRTLWSNLVPPKFFHLHEIVKQAQKAALQICRPGTPIKDLDAAARRVMREHGVEELFVHSLGHGIGLETHEFPRISEKGEQKDTLLKEGMVITIEPGLYAAGICGTRHEDTVIVRKDGPENLYWDLNV